MTSTKNKLCKLPAKITAWALLLVFIIGMMGGLSVWDTFQRNHLYIGDPSSLAAPVVQDTRRENAMRALETVEEGIRVLVENRIDPAEINWNTLMLPIRYQDMEIRRYDENWDSFSFFDCYIFQPLVNELHRDMTDFRFILEIQYQLPSFASTTGYESGSVTLVTPGCDAASLMREIEDAPAEARGGDHFAYGDHTYTLRYMTDPNAQVQDDFAFQKKVMERFYDYRYIPAFVCLICAALAVVLGIFLLVLSGKRYNTDGITRTWFDRIPGDLWLCLVACAVTCLIAFGGSMSFGWIYPGNSLDYILLVQAGGAVLFGSGLWLSVLSVASLVTRARSHTLWTNNLLVRWGGSIKAVCKKYLGWLPRMLKNGVLYGVRFIRAGGASRMGLVLILGAYLLSLIVSFFFALLWSEVEVFVFSIILSTCWMLAALVALGQMVALDKGAQALAAGDLAHKIDDSKLWMGFSAHAQHLNAIADGMNAAVENRMKSERLKTELLTNVSHDIKTPLTSIINYVDLLQNCPADEAHAQERADYLDVLDRQSHRLKKLLEDLLEASKASTGNIRAELTPTDVSELLRQAAGEYEERLTAAQLTPVITLPAGKTTVLADGRLLWRIFDNMLNNIAKYSMPGTRVYLAVENAGASWQVTFKNISREPLNIAANELMERFVRGDASRTTEGNGLGLSIAQSLAHCMNAEFDLSIDGDLFRTRVSLPKHTEKTE